MKSVARPVNLVESRSEVSLSLFESASPVESRVDTGSRSVVERFRNTDSEYSLKPLDNYGGKVLLNTVIKVLTDQHLSSTKPKPNPDAVFGFVNFEKDIDIVSAMTATAIWNWDHSINEERLFPISINSQIITADNEQVIVETALAAMQTLQAVSVNHSKPASTLASPTEHDKRIATNLLINWGPDHALDIMNGNIISDWLDSEKIQGQEREKWIKFFTQAKLKVIVNRKVDNPRGRLAQVRSNYATLKDENISEVLDCSIQEAQELFSDKIRRYYSLNNIEDPLKPIKNAKMNFDLMSDHALSKILKCTEEEVQELVPAHIRRSLALANTSDPFSPIEKMMKNVDLLTDEAIQSRYGVDITKVQEMFPTFVRKFIATTNRDDLFKGLDRYYDNMQNFDVSKISCILGQKIEHVDKIFSIGIRKHIMLHNPVNIEGAIKKIYSNYEQLSDKNLSITLGWSLDKIKATFPPHVKIELATRYIANPFPRVVQIYSKSS